MSEFIVLGLIPGTNIQISFVGWTIIFVVLIVGYCIIRRERRTRTLRFLLIRASLALAVRRQTRT
jgi:hypothetical protein